MAKLAIGLDCDFICSPAVDFGTGSALLTWTLLPIRRCNGGGGGGDGVEVGQAVTECHSRLFAIQLNDAKNSSKSLATVISLANIVIHSTIFNRRKRVRSTSDPRLKDPIRMNIIHIMNNQRTIRTRWRQCTREECEGRFAARSPCRQRSILFSATRPGRSEKRPYPG
jgi:hypothetical protein